jgi:hypothetical protein
VIRVHGGASEIVALGIWGGVAFAPLTEVSNLTFISPWLDQPQLTKQAQYFHASTVSKLWVVWFELSTGPS